MQNNIQKPSAKVEEAMPDVFRGVGVTLSLATGMMATAHGASQLYRGRESMANYSIEYAKMHKDRAIMVSEGSDVHNQDDIVLYTEMLETAEAKKIEMIESGISIGDFSGGLLLGAFTGLSAYAVLRGTRLLEGFYDTVSDIFTKKGKQGDNHNAPKPSV